MSLSVLLSQIGVSLVVVACYHLWVSRGKQPVAAPEERKLAPLPQLTQVPVVPAPPAPIAAVAIPAAPKVITPADPTPPEIVVVIAAAIAVVLGRSHRILSVSPSTARAPEVNVWAMEGRMEQFMSHKIR